MKPKKCRRILNGGALAAMGVVFVSYLPFFHSIQREKLAAATVLILSDCIFGFVFLRCPHCKKLLNFRWFSQGICHNCGEGLEEE